MEKIVENTLQDAAAALDSFLKDKAAISAVSKAGKALVECFSAGRSVRGSCPGASYQGDSHPHRNC